MHRTPDAATVSFHFISILFYSNLYDNFYIKNDFIEAKFKYLGDSEETRHSCTSECLGLEAALMSSHTDAQADTWYQVFVCKQTWF